MPGVLDAWLPLIESVRGRDEREAGTSRLLKQRLFVHFFERSGVRTVRLRRCYAVDFVISMSFYINRLRRGVKVDSEKSISIGWWKKVWSTYKNGPSRCFFHQGAEDARSTRKP